MLTIHSDKLIPIITQIYVVLSHLCLRVLFSLVSVLLWTMRGEGDTETLGLLTIPGVPTGETFGTKSDEGEDGTDWGLSSTYT